MRLEHKSQQLRLFKSSGLTEDKSLNKIWQFRIR